VVVRVIRFLRAELGVDDGFGLLHIAIGVVHLVGRAVVADVEMNKASLGLSAY